MRVARPAEASPACCVAALRGETGRRTPRNRSDAVTSAVRSRRWEIGSQARCGLRMTADRTSVRPVRPTVWRPWAEPVNGLFGVVGADVRRTARVCGRAVPARGQAGCTRKRVRATGDRTCREAGEKTGGWFASRRRSSLSKGRSDGRGLANAGHRKATPPQGGGGLRRPANAGQGRPLFDSRRRAAATSTHARARISA